MRRRPSKRPSRRQHRHGAIHRVRLWHGHRSLGDATLQRERHPSVLRERSALPEAVRMKISLDWLRDWVDLHDDVPALAHALTMAGLEIEGIHHAGPDLKGIVVGEVLAVEKHPDAEKL